MQVTIYGVQEPVAGKFPVKVFHNGNEIIEIPKQQQATLDVPEGDFLEFKSKNRLSTEVDVIGKHIILSWQRRTDSLYAFVTNSPERILARLKKANKKGLFYSLIEEIAYWFN